MGRKKKVLNWRRLDNSAKIFPLSTGEKYSTVFRLSVVLTDDVDRRILKSAVISTLRTYNFFKVKMKAGFFWYYLEYNVKDPIISEEKEYPCQYINPKENNDYLFKITYFKNKINIDIAHSLADGNSASLFFKEIVYEYLEIKYNDKLDTSERLIKKIDYDEEDSYIRNYEKKLKNTTKSGEAYNLKGRKIRLQALSAVHEIIDLQGLKKVCDENNSTITQYLTAVLIYSIYMTNYQKSKMKKPIRVCVPVNLRKYYPSKTLSNFFSYIMVECDFKNGNINSFDEILHIVKCTFEKELSKENIANTMSKNVKIGINGVIRCIPLFLKTLIVRLSYIKIRKYSTITFSNIGRMGIVGKYKDYIQYFMMLISPDAVEKIKCSACSFENKLIFTFTSILDSNEVEKYFFEFLNKHEIKIEIESNGVLNDISTETKC